MLKIYLYLISFIAFPIVKSLNHLGKKLVILYIVHVNGQGGEGHPLLNGLDIHPGGNLVLLPR